MSLEAQIVLSLIFWAIVILGSVYLLTSPQWHRKVRKHKTIEKRVSVGMFDPSKGLMIECSCGKLWCK